jgi:hypothetical protein
MSHTPCACLIQLEDISVEPVLLLSADPWELTDERTGEIRRGVSFWFVSDYRDGSNGLKPTKVSGDSKLLALVSDHLPCVASLGFATRPGAGNKASLQLVDVEVHRRFDLEGLLAEAIPS